MRDWPWKSTELRYSSTAAAGRCALTLVCVLRARIYTEQGKSLMSLGKGMFCYEEENIPFPSKKVFWLHLAASVLFIDDIGHVCYHGGSGNLYWAISLTMKCENKLLPASLIVDE